MAFADESGSDASRDPDAYILAAAVLTTTATETVRATVKALRKRGQRKVRWRDESRQRRREIAEVVAGLGVEHLVVVRNGVAGERSERRRRLCLTRFLYQLDQMAVAHITLESRGPSDDRRDLTLAHSLRAARTLSSRLRVDHVAGPAEPLLWVPDAVCGAIVQDRVGDSLYLSIMAKETEVRVIRTGANPFSESHPGQ